jgi:hypothetical protein
MTKEAFLVLMLISLALLITIPLSNAEYLPNPPLPTISIKADGSIEPSTAPIQRNGNTYTLTDNITNYHLSIQCDNIIVDGRGFTIKGRESAIFLLNAPKYTDFRQNVTITNFVIQDFFFGISGIYSNCIIKGNTINCYNAIDIFNHCTNNQIVGNTLIGSSQGNGYGIAVAGSSNVISGNRIAKFYRSIWLDNGENNTVSNNILSNTTSNIVIDHATNTISKDNIVGYQGDITSITPAPTTTPQANSDYSPNQTFLIIVVGIVVIVAVASLSIVYFKRRKSSK